MAEQIFDILGCLRLGELKDEWVKGVWDSDFSEVDLSDDVSIDQTDRELTQILQTLRAELTQWTAGITDKDLWMALTEKEISLKALVACLARLIISGHKNSAGVDKKILGCVGAQVYTKLLLVPGSVAFKVFHPELYEKSIDYLKQILILGTSAGNKRKKSSSPVQSSQGKRKTKRRNKDKRGSTEMDDTELPAIQDSDEELNDEDDEATKMTPQDINIIRTNLRALLVDMISLLESFSLRQSLSSASHTVQILADLSRFDIESFDGNFGSRVPLKIRCIPALAFKGLSFLCLQQHGHVGILMNATCKCLLPSLLYLIGNKPVQTINKQLQLIQEHAKNFVAYLLTQNEDKIQNSVRTLIQHMCIKVTDRSEYRTKVAQAVVLLAQQFSDENYCKMIQWFYKLSKHSQINNRVFAIEIVSSLLSTPSRQVTSDIAAELLPYLSHRSLLGILIDRCSDKAPTVRARAIVCFGQCLISKDEVIAGTVREIMTPQLMGRQGHQPRLVKTPGPINNSETIIEDTSQRVDNVTIVQEGSTIVTEKEAGQTANNTPLLRVALTPGFDPNLSDSEGLFSMLRRRAKDDKLNVRKASIQALENAIRFEAPHFTKQNLEVLTDHCRDPGLSVRKQALQSLTDILMEMSHDKFLQTTWLIGVLPLVLDRESSLSEKCFEILEDLILNNVVLKVRSTSDCHHLAWNLLGIIAEPHSVDQRRYLQKACHHWSRQGKIKSTLISALETHIGTENNEAALMLLAEIVPAAPKIGHSWLMKYWKEQENQESNIEIMGRALIVTKNVVKFLSLEDRTWLIENLKCRLLAFHLPPEVLSATISTLAKMYEIQHKESGNKSKKTDWCHELLSVSDKYLSKVILHETASACDEESVICHLFTLGEVVQLCPSSVQKRIFLLIQSIIASPCIASLPPSQSQPSSQSDNSHSSETSVNGVNRSEEDPLASSQGSSNSQDSQGLQGSQSSQPLTQFRGSKMSERVRAFAFITFGKLCLQHEGLAKKCIAALARELEISTNTAIRNNVMIVMCDLCVRYTTTANNYISNISSALKDPSPLLRKQTVTLITRLLQEDFLKWKGALFYRFIPTIFDECEDIRKFSEYCLLHMMLVRHPNILFQHFIECIFHFNDYMAHTIYNKFKQTDKDRENFSLKGDKKRKKRQQIYQFLLENMKDEHRFQIQSKVCQEILGALVDGILPFDDSTKDLLQDSLCILSCKEIKLTSLRVNHNEEMPGDEQEMAAVVMAVTKKTIITQVLKKNVIEHLVPVVVSLKHMMEKKRSPLLSELMMYLRELMKDYKNEVKDILSTDKQLAAEIEYDLRKFDEQQLERQSNSVQQAQGTPIITGSPVPIMHSPSRPGTPIMHDSSRTGTGSPVPIQHGSSRPGSPFMHGSSRCGTPTGSPRSQPAKKMPAPFIQGAQLATLAVLNASRKRIEKVQGNKADTPAVSLDDKETDPSIPVVMVTRDDNSTKQDASSNLGTPSVIGRLNPKIHRAISTPAVAMGNITFHGDGNMTCLPPSPISEQQSFQRIYDESLDDKENEENNLPVNSPNIRMMTSLR